MKTYLLLALSVWFTSCTPKVTISSVTVTYDLSHPITGLDSIVKNAGFESPDSPLQVIHGVTSDNSTHPDYLKGSLVSIPGHEPAAQVLFHFLSPGHAGTETVTLETVKFVGSTLLATYRLESPEVNTADFAQFGSSVVLNFR